MSATKAEKEFVSYIVELMQTVGAVHARNMFGGYGIYLEGLMFGLVADSVLYLKADKYTENEFRDRGLEAFTYYKKDKEYRMSYYEAPEEALEDAEEMKSGVIRAYGVALTAAANKRWNKTMARKNTYALVSG